VPENFNTDQGCQFTSDDFIGVLKRHGIQASMDGKGRRMDNVFVERLWGSLKYEQVYLKAYESMAETREQIPDRNLVRSVPSVVNRRELSEHPPPPLMEPVTEAA